MVFGVGAVPAFLTTRDAMFMSRVENVIDERPWRAFRFIRRLAKFSRIPRDPWIIVPGVKGLHKFSWYKNNPTACKQIFLHVMQEMFKGDMDKRTEMLVNTTILLIRFEMSSKSKDTLRNSEMAPLYAIIDDIDPVDQDFIALATNGDLRAREVVGFAVLLMGRFLKNHPEASEMSLKAGLLLTALIAARSLTDNAPDSLVFEKRALASIPYEERKNAVLYFLQGVGEHLDLFTKPYVWEEADEEVGYWASRAMGFANLDDLVHMLDQHECSDRLASLLKKGMRPNEIGKVKKITSTDQRQVYKERKKLYTKKLREVIPSPNRDTLRRFVRAMIYAEMGMPQPYRNLFTTYRWNFDPEDCKGITEHFYEIVVPDVEDCLLQFILHCAVTFREYGRFRKLKNEDRAHYLNKREAYTREMQNFFPELTQPFYAKGLKFFLRLMIYAEMGLSHAKVNAYFEKQPLGFQQDDVLAIIQLFYKIVAAHISEKYSKEGEPSGVQSNVVSN